MAKWWRTAVGGLKTAASTPRLWPSPSSSIASYHTIQAIPRELTGRRISAKERDQGRIPGAVITRHYIRQRPSDDGSGKEVLTKVVSKKHLITTERKHIQTILEKVRPEFFCSTTFKLQIRAGPGSSVLLDSGTVLPLKIHRNEESGMILNLVFLWAEDSEELMVHVPLVFKGEDVCPGVKKGGRLNRMRNYLQYLCPVEHIPPKIEVDVSNLDVGDRVFFRDLKVHPSLKLQSKNESFPICKIVEAKPASSKPADHGSSESANLGSSKPEDLGSSESASLGSSKPEDLGFSESANLDSARSAESSIQ